MSLTRTYYAALLGQLAWASVSRGETIIRPASEIPGQGASLEMPVPRRSENSKSVVRPLRRVLNVAVGQVKDPEAESRVSELPSDEENDTAETPVAANAQATAKGPVPTNAPATTKAPAATTKAPAATTKAPAATTKAPAAAEKTEPSEKQIAPNVASESVGKGAAPEADSWDSATKRLDHQDVAASTTNGVRVEDIIEPTSEYQYSAGRRKNPFVAPLVLGKPAVQKELGSTDIEIPIVNPLQAFTVGQLAVIGVWEGEDHVWKALIETPTNQGIETKLGDPAGNSGGRIMSITPESVVVREFMVRADGTREYRDVPLYMGSDKVRGGKDDPEDLIGARLILRPGASSPEIDRGGTQGSVPSVPPPIVESGTPGTLSTVETVKTGAAANEKPSEGVQEGLQKVDIPSKSEPSQGGAQ